MSRKDYWVDWPTTDEYAKWRLEGWNEKQIISYPFIVSSIATSEFTRCSSFCHLANLYLHFHFYSSAEYIKQMMKSTKEKEEAVNQLQSDLKVKKQKTEDKSV